MKFLGAAHRERPCLPICPYILPPPLLLTLNRICNVMDKFVTRKTREETNVGALVDHLKSQGTQVA